VTVKVDRLKPQWHDSNYRRPTVEHLWPVSSYGSNNSVNLAVYCNACNIGKANTLIFEQTSSFVGLPAKTQFVAATPLMPAIFYAQLLRSPLCSRSGKNSTTVELTVEMLDPDALPTIDILQTVESPGI
jgi:hypothetical protein